MDFVGCRLAVVNVGNDGKIADIGLLCHTGETSVKRPLTRTARIDQDCWAFWAFQTIQKDSSQYFS